MTNTFLLHVFWVDRAGIRLPEPVLEPNPWPLELLFGELLSKDTSLMARFLEALRDQPSTTTAWSHDLLHVELDQPRTVRLVDAFFPKEHSVEIDREELIRLVEVWRDSVSGG